MTYLTEERLLIQASAREFAMMWRAGRCVINW